MKTIKVLATSIMLFVTASVNFVAAQSEVENDSIYGVKDVSISNEGVLSFKFYSTYKMKDLQKIHLDFYDKVTEDSLGSAELDCVTSNDYTHIYYLGGQGGQYNTDAVNGIAEIELEINLLWEFSELIGKPLIMKLHLEGEGYTPPSNGIRAGIIGQSNVLTFFLIQQ
ncbi:MAG: hypothetical protein LBR81_01045 [Prevotellaceae bacterium]|jgi:hypothetical protein|nr:hypothetical protein [Prevotellaceae bacterium]